MSFSTLRSILGSNSPSITIPDHVQSSSPQSNSPSIDRLTNYSSDHSVDHSRDQSPDNSDPRIADNRSSDQSDDRSISAGGGGNKRKAAFEAWHRKKLAQMKSDKPVGGRSEDRLSAADQAVIDRSIIASTRQYRSVSETTNTGEIGRLLATSIDRAPINGFSGLSNIPIDLINRSKPNRSSNQPADRSVPYGSDQSPISRCIPTDQAIPDSLLISQLLSRSIADQQIAMDPLISQSILLNAIRSIPNGAMPNYGDHLLADYLNIRSVAGRSLNPRVIGQSINHSGSSNDLISTRSSTSIPSDRPPIDHLVNRSIPDRLSADMPRSISNAADRSISSISTSDQSIPPKSIAPIHAQLIPTKPLIPSSSNLTDPQSRSRSITNSKPQSTTQSISADNRQGAAAARNLTAPKLSRHNDAAFYPNIQCILCHEWVCSRNRYMHIESHFQYRPYKCSVCGYDNRKQIFIELHITRVHKGAAQILYHPDSELEKRAWTMAEECLQHTRQVLLKRQQSSGDQSIDQTADQVISTSSSVVIGQAPVSVSSSCASSLDRSVSDSSSSSPIDQKSIVVDSIGSDRSIGQGESIKHMDRPSTKEAIDRPLITVGDQDAPKSIIDRPDQTDRSIDILAQSVGDSSNRVKFRLGSSPSPDQSMPTSDVPLPPDQSISTSDRLKSISTNIDPDQHRSISIDSDWQRRLITSCDTQQKSSDVSPKLSNSNQPSPIDIFDQSISVTSDIDQSRSINFLPMVNHLLQSTTSTASSPLAVPPASMAPYSGVYRPRIYNNQRTEKSHLIEESRMLGLIPDISDVTAREQQCRLCGAHVLKTPSLLEEHARTHLTRPGYGCSLATCSVSHHSKNFVIRHMKEVHRLRRGIVDLLESDRELLDEYLITCGKCFPEFFATSTTSTNGQQEKSVRTVHRTVVRSASDRPMDRSINPSPSLLEQALRRPTDPIGDQPTASRNRHPIAQSPPPPQFAALLKSLSTPVDRSLIGSPRDQSINNNTNLRQLRDQFLIAAQSLNRSNTSPIDRSNQPPSSTSSIAHLLSTVDGPPPTSPVVYCRLCHRDIPDRPDSHLVHLEFHLRAPIYRCRACAHHLDVDVDRMKAHVDTQHGGKVPYYAETLPHYDDQETKALKLMQLCFQGLV